MLNKIVLSQFKCFEELRLPLGQLTLLTGLNGSGKSTVMQALVLIHQTITENEWSKELHLDGTKISLGTAGDVIDQVTGRNQFGIGVDWHGNDCVWHMESVRTVMSAPVHAVQWNQRTFADHWTLLDAPLHYFLPTEILHDPQEIHAKTLASALEKLVYISAERCGPRETYSLSTMKQKTDVGSTGDRAPGVIYTHADRGVSPMLCLDDAAPTLPRQVEAWMNRFFPGAGIDIQPVKNANLVTLGLRTNPSVDYQRPQNVGYGLSHILPIITACLVAEAGNVLLIENPEVHLHPAGQAMVGHFLALAAASGVQVLLETHSDHVLNGVRRAVRDGMLTPDQAKIHFFMPRPQTEKAPPQVTTITVNEKGGLDAWPEGFFDQFDKDLSFLTGWDE